jgi:hypothetical protein
MAKAAAPRVVTRASIAKEDVKADTSTRASSMAPLLALRDDGLKARL